MEMKDDVGNKFTCIVHIRICRDAEVILSISSVEFSALRDGSRVQV